MVIAIFWAFSLTALSLFGFILLCLALAGALLTGYIRASAKFITLKDILYRLDEEHSLGGKLIAAVDEECEYPNFCQTHHSFTSTPLSTPASVALALLVVIFLLPPAQLEAYSPLSPPLEWSRIEAALTELKADQPFSEAQLSALEQEFQQLANLPAQKWYSPEVLEATDALMEKIQQYYRESANGQSLQSKPNAQLDQKMETGPQNSMQSNQQLSPQSMNTDLMSGLPSSTTVGQGDRQDPSQNTHGKSCAANDKQGDCESNSKPAPEGTPGRNDNPALKHQENNQNTRGGDISRGPGTAPIEFGERSRVLGGQRQYITSPEANPKTNHARLGVGFSSRSSTNSNAVNPIESLSPSSTERSLVIGNYLSPSEQSAVKRFYSTR